MYLFMLNMLTDFENTRLELYDASRNRGNMITECRIWDSHGGGCEGFYLLGYGFSWFQKSSRGKFKTLVKTEERRFKKLPQGVDRLWTTPRMALCLENSGT